MEGKIRSGGALKVKNSSGCLIVKRKDEHRHANGRLAGQNDYSEGRKRPGLMESDWGSGEEYVEHMTRKGNNEKLRIDSMCYDVIEPREMVSGRNNVGSEWSERKRIRYESFESGECDGVDVAYSSKMVKCRGSGNSKELRYAGGNLMVDKGTRDSYLVGSSSAIRKGFDCHGVKNKEIVLKADEAHMPISLLRLKNQENVGKPIRFQGKNGVLKVMVNKKTKMDLRSLHKNYNLMENKGGNAHTHEDVVEKDALTQLPSFSVSAAAENRSLFVDNVKSIEKNKTERKVEKIKPVMNKDSNAQDLIIDGTDTVLKLAPPGLQTCVSNNAERKYEARSPSHDNAVPVKDNEVKVKRGGSTEKQILREKIRQMLVDAGWTIDYRGRRNRDYLDAVYINPSGTAYWSIIKAYEAFKKKSEKDDGKSRSNPSFAPLSEELINKLTRKTKKKIELERKKKMEEDGMIKKAEKSAPKEGSKILNSDLNEKKLSSFRKQKKKNASSVVGQESKENLNDVNPKRKSEKVLQRESSKIIGRLTLTVRNYGERKDSECKESIPCSGKTSILAWLIDSGTVQLSEKVQYFNRKKSQVMLEGWVTRDGIHCGCCSKILTPSKFELHAGGKFRQPFQNIFLESGTSLLQCQIDAWNHQELSLLHNSHSVVYDDPYDDTCGICGDGGDLVCCDSCHSTFHQICLEIQNLPSGDWHCSSCRCKFCGYASEKDSEENDNDVGELIKCSFCEKQYHRSCSPSLCAQSFNLNGAMFCGLKCQLLYDHLLKIVGIKRELGAGYSWSLIRHMEVSDNLLGGFNQRVECNSKLAVALSIMDECFFPIIDRRSGINIIRNIVYNNRSNFNRLNYNGFYTAILEQGDEIVSAASIRFHGSNLAEMPLMGTRQMYRRKGLGRLLLSAIEKELSSMRVEKLVIPTSTEFMHTWTTVFGFYHLDDARMKEIKLMNIMVFPGADLLQKQLVKHGKLDDLSESMQIQVQLPERSDADFSLEPQRWNADSEGLHKSKIIGDVDFLVSGSSKDFTQLRLKDAVSQ